MLIQARLQVPMPFRWRKALFVFLSNSPIISRGIYGLKVRDPHALQSYAYISYAYRYCSCVSLYAISQG